MNALLDDVRSAGELDEAALDGAARLLGDLVDSGAALGWLVAPARDEVADLLTGVAAAAGRGDGALVLARDATTADVLGLGYWLRQTRPTHRPHADLERVAVRADQQGQGLGRRLTETLVGLAVAAGVEQLTLDLRADNLAALSLYESVGFHVYGRLREFVAVGAVRYDKILCVLDLRGLPHPQP